MGRSVEQRMEQPRDFPTGTAPALLLEHLMMDQALRLRHGQMLRLAVIDPTRIPRGGQEIRRRHKYGRMQTETASEVAFTRASPVSSARFTEFQAEIAMISPKANWTNPERSLRLYGSLAIVRSQPQQGMEALLARPAPLTAPATPSLAKHHQLSHVFTDLELGLPDPWLQKACRIGSNAFRPMCSPRLVVHQSDNFG